jgi:hypothetical protein
MYVRICTACLYNVFRQYQIGFLFESFVPVLIRWPVLVPKTQDAVGAGCLGCLVMFGEAAAYRQIADFVCFGRTPLVLCHSPEFSPFLDDD